MKVWRIGLVLGLALTACEEEAPPEATGPAVMVDGAVEPDPDQGQPRPDMAVPPPEVDMAVAAPDMAPPAVDMAPPEPDATPCTPVNEECNGADDDCDGEIDEELPDVPCYNGPAGTEGVGRCRPGRLECRNGDWTTCLGEVGPAGLDECNDRQDNDCDGTTDEGCQCRNGDTQDCGSDVGACVQGTQTCINNEWGPCEGATPPAADDDDCDGVDDDCDARTDEGYLAVPTECGEGACMGAGEMACQGGRVVDTCEPGGAPDDDCNGVDDDCDGGTDEGYAGAPTQCGVGACAADGEMLCREGEEVDGCTPGEPADEVADEADRDCDGRVDEGFAFTTAQLQARIDRDCGNCHGNSGGLTLRGDFLANTENQGALGAGMNRLTPGDPQNSYLFRKVEGTQRAAGGGGRQMPLGRAAWADWEIERFALWITGYEGAR